MIKQPETKTTDAQTTTTNMWQDILREAMTKKDLDDSHIFIFGDKYVGKRSLIKIINKELNLKGELEEQKKILSSDETVSKFGLIDYTYLNIRKINEQDSESIGKINIWIANDQITREFFESIIKPEYLLKAICIIMVDLSRPWEIMDSLKKWTNFVYDSFSSILLKFPLEKQQQLRNQIVEHIKLYEEPQFDEEGNFKKEPPTEENIQLKLEIPIKEGILSVNMGVPVIFVVNKSDIVMQAGEKKRFEEDSDFIIKHIRNYALSYGATIIYTSAKQNINLNVLYEYVLHRIYKFDLQYKPNPIDKDSFFIPTGYDSIATLKSFDTQGHLSMLYEDKVPYVKPKNIIKEDEVSCEDLNAFLGKIRLAPSRIKTGEHHTVGDADYKTKVNTSEIGQNDNYGTNVSEQNSSKNLFQRFKNYNSGTKTSSIDVSNIKTDKELVTPSSTYIRSENSKKTVNDQSTSKEQEKFEKTKNTMMQKLEQLRKDKKKKAENEENK